MKVILNQYTEDPHCGNVPFKTAVTCVLLHVYAFLGK